MEVVLWGPMQSTTPVCPLILYGLSSYVTNREEFLIFTFFYLTIQKPKYMFASDVT